LFENNRSIPEGRITENGGRSIFDEKPKKSFWFVSRIKETLILIKIFCQVNGFLGNDQPIMKTELPMPGTNSIFLGMTYHYHHSTE
jgi:hypothetical protein